MAAAGEIIPAARPCSPADGGAPATVDRSEAGSSELAGYRKARLYGSAGSLSYVRRSQ